MTKEKIIIYQVLPRLFDNNKRDPKPNGSIQENGCGKFSSFSDKALKEIKKMGFNHIWYTGIIEHATQTDYSSFDIKKNHPTIVKGKAGSPYAIKDYYDIDPDLTVDVPNRMYEFENLVKRTHDAGLKIILDFVPNHVARQYKSDTAPKGVVDFGANDDTNIAFNKNNNFYYIPDKQFISPIKIESGKKWIESPAKATGNDCFTSEPNIDDWYETVKLNYGVDHIENTPSDFEPEPDTWLKMRDIIFYWVNKGVDGFRCDMAGMVPVEFWHWLTGEIRAKHPEICFIAEIYEPKYYNDYIFKGGFDYLYDKMFFYDIVREVMEGKSSASSITDIWKATEGLHNFLLYFILLC